MLTSISPLGERARGQRWAVTAAAYLIGSTAGGLSLGFGLGAVGGWLHPPPVLTAVVCAVAAAADMAQRLPTLRRQVDEDWLTRYRGWVYGLGYGLQLGVGITTIVTSAATYATFALCLASGSAATGAAIGGCFGLVRALPLLLIGRAGTPHGLRVMAARLNASADAAQRMTVAALAGAAVVVLVGAT
ncbi:MAG: hypothetical protein NVSMB55_26720 [Mycobacteriales bacterium]